MDPADSHHNGTPFRPQNRSIGRLPLHSPSSSNQRPARASPYSPFPFGLPIQSSNRSLLSPGSLNQNKEHAEPTEKEESAPTENNSGDSSLHVFRGRVRAQDVYAGKLLLVKV